MEALHQIEVIDDANAKEIVTELYTILGDAREHLSLTVKPLVAENGISPHRGGFKVFGLPFEGGEITIKNNKPEVSQTAQDKIILDAIRTVSEKNNLYYLLHYQDVDDSTSVLSRSILPCAGNGKTSVMFY